MPPIRPQPYRLKWPLTPSQVEGLDEMLQILFKAVRTGGSASTSTALSTVVSGIGPPGSDGEDGADGSIGPPGANGMAGAAGASGAQGPVGLGVPGYDGEDGADSIVPGPPGNAGAPGSQGAQGPVGMGVPGYDGEDGVDGWPGPPGVSAVGAAGALVLLEQHTASASTSLDFTTGLTATYDDYLIEIVDLVVATNNVSLLMELSSTGGVSWTTTQDYFAAFTGIANGAAAFSGSNSPPSGTNWVLGNNISNTATRGFNGSIRTRSLLSTTMHKLMFGHISYSNQTNVGVASWFGILVVTTAMNAFRLRASSGNLASGTIRLYGLTK